MCDDTTCRQSKKPDFFLLIKLKRRKIQTCSRTIADIAGNKERCHNSYLQTTMAPSRIIKAWKCVKRHGLLPGRFRKVRQTVLRIRNSEFGLVARQRPIRDTVVTDNLLLKCDVVATKSRHIAVRFVEADPVHCPIRQMPRSELRIEVVLIWPQ
jgi:hypothetical protein